MKKVVIAADSFKGSISSAQFADVCCRVIKSVMPGCETVGLALGDGGEGTVDALAAALSAQMVQVTVSDPLLRPVTARYALSPDGAVAVMEMAQASGLPLLKAGERNPMAASSYGTGQMMAAALDSGCSEIMLGIGGSATNDGGLGMLCALGAVLRDGDGRVMDTCGCGADMAKVADIDLSGLHPRLADVRLTVACDVDNPFCGADGAAYVFAPQKGADRAMVEALDCGMDNLAGVYRRLTGIDVRHTAGAGAAGGLGGALSAVLGARLVPGIEMVLQAIGFDKLIAGADLVITGEGRIDSQTLMGKTPAGVLAAARAAAVPVVAVGGSVDHSPQLDEAGFAGIFSIQPAPVSLQEALDPATAARNLAATVTQIIRLVGAVS